MRPQAARNPLPAVAINAARPGSGVKDGQGSRLIRVEAGLIIGGFRLDMTRGAKTIISLKLNVDCVHDGCQYETYHPYAQPPPGQTTVSETREVRNSSHV